MKSELADSAQLLVHERCLMAAGHVGLSDPEFVAKGRKAIIRIHVGTAERVRAGNSCEGPDDQ